jgi:hypothetical protein
MYVTGYVIRANVRGLTTPRVFLELWTSKLNFAKPTRRPGARAEGGAKWLQPPHGPTLGRAS